jgi:hypothetical protein
MNIDQIYKSINADDKARMESIITLCLEYDRETDTDEKENILRTLVEIITNAPLDFPPILNKNS